MPRGGHSPTRAATKNLTLPQNTSSIKPPDNFTKKTARPARTASGSSSPGVVDIWSTTLGQLQSERPDRLTSPRCGRRAI